MSNDTWKNLGPEQDIKEGEVILRKTEDGERFVCTRIGGALTVLADQCPHQGYPLSQGDLKDGVLTCAWHNWKFDAKNGQCLTGVDAVAAPPCRVRDGQVEIDLKVDVAAETARAQHGIREGLFDNDPSRVVRDGLRLAKVHDGQMAPAFEALAEDTAGRSQWGFGHELATLADLTTWVDDGDLDASDAFGLAAVIVGERLAREPARESEAPKDGQLSVFDALEAEDRGQAEAAVRGWTTSEGPEAAVRAMLPFVARYILNYGHGAIYLAKGLELARRYKGAAEAIMASVAVNLGWATRESALPPWAATRRALDGVDELTVGDGPLTDRAAYEAQVLEKERAAVDATLEALSVGAAPHEVLQAIAHAAAVRLARFDATWPLREGYEVGLLDVSHAVTYAEACLALLEHADLKDAARMCVLTAGFVGKLAAGDGPAVAAEGGEDDLVTAVVARNEPQALGALEKMHGPDRTRAYIGLRPYSAYEAFVRPIFTAHAVKTNEALRRLEAADPHADAVYLQACVHTLAPRWRERDPRRMAKTARQFMKDGRPPQGLY